MRLLDRLTVGFAEAVFEGFDAGLQRENVGLEGEAIQFVLDSLEPLFHLV